MILGRRCPSCGRRGWRGQLTKVVAEGMKEGLKVNPEWLWWQCRHCGARFKERHYGEGVLEPASAAEWNSNVAG